MNEAVRTAASPAAIWGIVVLMTALTVVLVGAALVADWPAARSGQTARRPPWPGPEAGPAGGGHERRGAQAALAEVGPVLAAAEAPTLPGLPALAVVPAQRSGDDNRAGRAGTSTGAGTEAGPGSLWDVLPGQR